MRKGNREFDAELVQRIEQARDLLNEALVLSKKASRTVPRSSVTAPVKAKVRSSSIDFSTPMRAFVKKYATGMNGAKKFVLLVAYLTKGDSSKRVTLAEVEKHWNKMTANGLLGMKFNRLYTSRARENDWADTEKAGSYHLRPSWKDIFE
jgi:hypothetical protein